jgi:hypothetical protein
MPTVSSNISLEWFSRKVKNESSQSMSEKMLSKTMTVAAQNYLIVETSVSYVHDIIMIVRPYFILSKKTLHSDNQRIRVSSTSVPFCPDFTFSCSNTAPTAQATHRYNQLYLWMDTVGISLQILIICAVYSSVFYSVLYNFFFTLFCKPIYFFLCQSEPFNVYQSVLGMFSLCINK